MKRLLFAIASWCFLLSGCGDDPVTQPPTSIDTLTKIDTSFLPLAVGNEWKYALWADTTHTFFSRILRKVTIEDSLEYYEFEMGSPVGASRTYLIRYISPDVIEYYENHKRLLFLTFKDTATTWEDSSLPYKVDGPNPIESVVTPLGEFRNCTRIVFGGGEPAFALFFRGVGLVDCTWMPSYFLASHKLLGKAK